MSGPVLCAGNTEMNKQGKKFALTELQFHICMCVHTCIYVCVYRGRQTEMAEDQYCGEK